MGYIENNIFNQDKDTSSEKLSINKLGKFNFSEKMLNFDLDNDICLLYTSPSPRDDR